MFIDNKKKQYRTKAATWCVFQQTNQQTIQCYASSYLFFCFW